MWQGANSGVYRMVSTRCRFSTADGSTEPVTSSDGGGIIHRWIDNHGGGRIGASRNASRPPGQWQSYHIGSARRASMRREENGEHEIHPRGIQRAFGAEHVEVDGPTRAAMNIPRRPRIHHAAKAITGRSRSGMCTGGGCGRLLSGEGRVPLQLERASVNRPPIMLV